MPNWQKDPKIPTQTATTQVGEQSDCMVTCDTVPVLSRIVVSQRLGQAEEEEEEEEEEAEEQNQVQVLQLTMLTRSNMSKPYNSIVALLTVLNRIDYHENMEVH